MPTFDDLPFRSRPDLSPYLVHLTRRSAKRSAYENLKLILRGGKIRGSTNAAGRGFIKGSSPATCFMDIPIGALKYVLQGPKPDSAVKLRYEPYGVFVLKTTGYRKGCRPVMYLSDDELERVELPRRELWRVVKLHVEGTSWVSWLHEREWRCRGDFELPRSVTGVFVKTAKEASRLSLELHDHAEAYSCIPRCILPLSVVCQGLD